MKTGNIYLLIVLFMTSMVADAGLKPIFDGSTPMSVRHEMTQRYMKMMAANHQLNKVGKRETAALTSMGSPKVPVILVEFNDKKFTTIEEGKVNAAYDLFCNGTRDGHLYNGAGSYGAVRDYFAEQSDSLFQPEFVVIGPVTLSEGYGYYGKNSASATDVNISAFYRESIQEANKLNVDWNQFDNDRNGTIDMVFFIYAGPGENDSQNNDEYTIWPKENSSGGTIDGKRFGAYACCNEEFRGKLDGIGPMCHELSHALGLPDFYDTNYIAFGLDYWDIMDSGCYCSNNKYPCNYSAYEREFMGWRKLETLEAGVGQNVTVYPLHMKGSTSYKIVNAEDKDEYYVLENRQSEGWDKYLGYGIGGTYGYHHGLMVTHVQYVEGRWTGNSVNRYPDHQLITLIPADSTLHSSMFYGEDKAWSMEENKWVAGYDKDFFLKSASGDLYPGNTGKTDLQGRKAYVYSSTGDTPHMMNQPITDIEEHEDGSITFKFCGGDITAVNDVRNSDGIDNSSIFDMLGRRVSVDRNQLNTGIYIINGKKVLVK